MPTTPLLRLLLADRRPAASSRRRLCRGCPNRQHMLDPMSGAWAGVLAQEDPLARSWPACVRG